MARSYSWAILKRALIQDTFMHAALMQNLILLRQMTQCSRAMHSSCKQQREAQNSSASQLP